MTAENQNLCMMSRPTIWQRLGFGHAYVLPHDDESQFSEQNGWAPGALVTETYASLDLVDRLRILISGKLHIHVRTVTDQAVRRSNSVSAVRVLPPMYPFRPRPNAS